MKKIRLFCEECFTKRDMEIINLYITKKGNVRINCKCAICSQRYSFNRRPRVLYKVGSDDMAKLKEERDG